MQQNDINNRSWLAYPFQGKVCKLFSSLLIRTYPSSTKAPDWGSLSFKMFSGFVAVLGVRGGWEATRFPVGEWRTSSDSVLRDLAYLLLPRESRSFPTTPFHVRKKRTPVPSWMVSHYPTVRSIERSVSNLYVPWSGLYDPLLQSYILTIAEVVSRTFHGKGAEGNGETPAGTECLVRPHKAVSLRRLTALPRKASHSPQPHPLDKSLETEFSTTLPVS